MEFLPGTVGSGEKDIEVSLKSEAPLEQSETEPYAPPTADARIARRANILMYTRGNSLGRITPLENEFIRGCVTSKELN